LVLDWVLGDERLGLEPVRRLPPRLEP